MNKFLFIKYNKLTSMKNFTLKTTTTNVGMDIQRNSFSQLKGKRSGFFAFSSHLNIALLGLFIFFLGQKINAQTTVTYKEQTAYFNAGTVYSNGGGIYNQNAQQMGMWANLGGTKEVVAWRQFKTAGNVTGGTTRSLQVGDEFRITVGAHTVSGEMGFALLSSPTTRGNWANRLENAAISVNLTNYGNWYAKYFDGTTVNAATSSGSNNIGGTTSYKNFVFTCILTAPNRMNIKIDDGTTQSYLYDLLLNTSNPITEYAVYLKDDWDGSSKNNIYWNNSASSDLDYVKNTMTMPIGSSNATFTIAGVLPNGLDAASTSTGSTNALTKSGTGILTLSAANTYTGTTTVTAGTLTLGIANALPITASAGNIRFTGGTPTLNLGQFSLGSSTVSANSAGLLDFDVNTTVNLGAANGSAYSYYFKDSSAQTWSATTVTIGNWVGTAGATAGTGAGARRIFIGSSASLTTAQLNKIQFTGFAAGATQLASGEIVPRGSSSTITTGTVSGSPFCAGATSVSVPFTYSVAANFPSGGSCVFKTQLSDASGSFASPTDLQTVVSDASGSQSISVTIPSGTSTGSGYRIRVVSNSPAVDGADNGTNLTINALPTPTFTAQPGATACASTDVTYTTQSGQSSYIWSVPGVLNTDYSITSGGIGTGSNTVTLKWLTTGSKTVTINYTTSGCTAASATSSTATTVSALPTPTFTAQPGATACASTDVTYTTQSGQSNYIWTVPGVLNTDYSITSGGIGTGSNTVTLKWLTTGSKTVTINYTTSGCTAASATSSTATTVSAQPTTATNGSTQTICSTGTATLSGNAPSVGTGAWSVVSGPSTSSAQFSNTATPGAIFTPAGGSGSYVLRWTITNGGCSSSADATLTVTSGSLDGFNLQHWSAAPGAQQVCSGSSFTVYGQVYKAGLTNTTSGSGTGIEAQFGYNTSDTNPSGWSTWAAATFGSDKPSNDEYQYNFTPPSTGTYYFTFRYRLNGCAWQYGGYKSDGSLGAWNGTTYVNGSANVSATAPNAAAGPDISQCNNGTFTMAANAASPGTGTWTVVSGTASITSANSATSTITGVPLGTSATLRWTITNSPCSPTQDVIIVTNSSTNTWIGGTSTDWNTPANWCGGVPTSASNVVIPSGTTFSPSIYQTANAVANSVNINNGATLSMSNAYSLSITSGGSIINNGTFNAGNGTVNFAGGGTITGTILFYNVNLNGTVSFSNAVTINNNLRISSGGAVTTNSPTYGSSSSLQYYSGGSYNRNLEWNATSGAGYPNNVTVENNTVLNVKNGNNSYKKIAGNLTITTGSTFKITDMTTGTPSALGVTGISVEVLGDILNNGTITSNGTTNTRLKGNNFVNGYSNATATTTLSGNFGGDLEVAGNFTNNAVFTVSQRAVFFTGTTTQVVDGTAVAPFNIDYVVVAKNPGSGTVLLNKDLLVSGPQGGSAVVFYAATDIIDLNGFKLTVGTSGVYSTVVGDGKFKGGSNDSELSILGIGQIGTLNFDNTTPGVTNNLKNLTLNRTISSPTYPTAGFSLGSDVTISNTATLTAGTINLGSANMTIGASASIAVSSPDATKMIIASGTGELRKTFTAAGSFTYPIGDNVGTAEYSPATLTFSGTPSGYAGVRVQNAKHPNINVGISDYITRYWPVSSTISSPTCTASFTYLAADENGTPANYFGGRYLSPDWYCLDDVDQVSRIISKTGLSAFGDFTVYNPPVMTSTLTSSAATICANTSTNLQVTIGGGDSPYTVGPFTVVYYDSVLATNVTVNSYTSGANIPVSPTASTTYTLQSVTSSKACYSSASDTKTVSIGGTSTYASGSWTPSAPVSTSTAIIDGGTYNVAANIDACSLEVKNSAVVTIPSTYKVTLSGALTVETGSSFTLENDTNLVQTGGTTNPNTGSIRVKRNSSSLYLLDYTLWSSSVANQNLYSFSPDTAANRFYIYDEPTDQYNSLSSNNSFTVGRGYLIRVPRTFSATTPGVFTGIFTGKPNSGDITYGMSKSLNGFNAVGNPYPSQINVHNFIDANISNIQGTLYFWRKRNNPLATSYATLTKLAYAANAAAGGDTGSTYYNTMTTPAADWVINVGQGFFVQAKSASNLVFTNTMRRGTNNGNQFFRTSNKLVEDPNTFKLNLTSTNGVFSQMVLGYSPEYTLGIDDGIDGFNINSTNYLCSTIEGAAYVIQGRPEFSATDVVPLEYKIENADQYSIAIEQLSGVFASQDVFLKDKLTNTIHDLKSGPYDFGSESGNFKERFEVVYESPLAVNQNSFNENNVVVYKQNQELMVNTGKIPMSNVKVYDIRGRLLIAKDHIDATQVKLFTGTTQEVLLVKITSDSYGTVTKKVVN
jgi:autotransporter-associated beta strand protein